MFIVLHGAKTFKWLRINLALLLSLSEKTRAGAKDRSWRLTSTFSPYKSHLKRLSTVIFSEVGGFFYFKINIFLKSGPYTGLKKLDFWPTFVEPT